jgi:hypothetical protein
LHKVCSDLLAGGKSNAKECDSFNFAVAHATYTFSCKLDHQHDEEGADRINGYYQESRSKRPLAISNQPKEHLSKVTTRDQKSPDTLSDQCTRSAQTIPLASHHYPKWPVSTTKSGTCAKKSWVCILPRPIPVLAAEISSENAFTVCGGTADDYTIATVRSPVSTPILNHATTSNAAASNPSANHPADRQWKVIVFVKHNHEIIAESGWNSGLTSCGSILLGLIEVRDFLADRILFDWFSM